MMDCNEANKEIFNNGFNVKDSLKHLTIEELKEVSKEDRLPYAVCALNVTGNANVGMMIRSAHLLRAEKFIVMGRRQYDKRGAVGSQNYIDVDKVSAMKSETEIDDSIFWDYMSDSKYWPIFCETGGRSLHTVNWMDIQNSIAYDNFRICLVFGNEGIGIPDSILSRVSKELIVSVEQFGVMRSLNVGVAASIVMYQLAMHLKIS